MPFPLRTLLVAWILLNTSLEAQNSNSAPTPRFAGVYQPGIGFLRYESQNAFDSGRSKATSGIERLSWEPQWPHQQTKGIIWSSENFEINALEVIYSSRYADPTGRGGNFLLSVELPGEGVQEIPLHGMPLGGNQGQLQSWRIIIKLTNGLEWQTKTSHPIHWSWESNAPETGLCLLKDERSKKQPYLKALTQEQGFKSIYPLNPGDGDNLTLQVKKNEAREVYSFAVQGGRPGKRYILFLANKRNQEEILTSTLLINKSTVFNRIPMDQGECTIQLPSKDIPVFIQALEFDGKTSDLSLTGASQGLRYTK